MVHLIVDRLVHNKTEESLHRVVSIRRTGCAVISENQDPLPGIEETDSESQCGRPIPCTARSESFCQLRECEENEFCNELDASTNDRHSTAELPENTKPHISDNSR